MPGESVWKVGEVDLEFVPGNVPTRHPPGQRPVGNVADKERRPGAPPKSGRQLTAKVDQVVQGRHRVPAWGILA
jgi:hypothetical protein